MKAVHMGISTNEEQDNKIVYNDPASEVLRERYKVNKQNNIPNNWNKYTF